ncbi:hypothetical protein Q5741_01135 [Paenibacillus sp. JX-17]|uniref:DUF4025 domain-containing protein n=1 Tax=Paenibacillus lacisoli TaxID=3064525 RepID=A0ABT9C6Y1_9BACL|nr:hypothetical protein [Paenibacillus sp. JX-17]MDO7905013.1 hypothetical protein [Paenibacillus sp. JX-17]
MDNQSKAKMESRDALTRSTLTESRSSIRQFARDYEEDVGPPVQGVYHDQRAPDEQNRLIDQHNLRK